MLYSALLVLMGSTFLMLRLGPGGTFPRPLTKEEENRCVERWVEQGDLEARNTLIEHNLRLVAHVIKKYYSSAEDMDDLISIGTIGLIKGINTYRPDKGVRLATYASRCIENAIQSQRNNRRLRWRNGCLLRQNGACWHKWNSAAIF
ncbi:MAG: sigma-70 family RNA polymerase sigma factor [Oscillospiraceae bacterium]|nr:sigma-70 family RNA polymerase sigma factor [Oscillospiraceae bacterium]